MKPLFYLSVIVMLFCAVSCQKEISEPLRNTDPAEIPLDTAATGNGLLVKEVTIQRVVDSTITNYSYDDNKRLQTITTISYSNSGVAPDISIQGTRFYRDGQGRIIKTAFKNASDDVGGPDSLYTNIFYAGSSPNVLYSLLIRNYSGIIVYDSTVYSYNESGNVSKQQHYFSTGWPDVAAARSTYEIYESDAANNLLKAETYSYPATPGSDSLQLGTYYSYDTKKNAYTKGEYADPVGFLTGKNNPLSQHTKFLVGNVYENSDYTSSYIYDSGDKPLSRTSVSVTDASDVSETFYYYGD